LRLRRFLHIISPVQHAVASGGGRQSVRPCHTS
jgi:hypothetical protein